MMGLSMVRSGAAHRTTTLAATLLGSTILVFLLVKMINVIRRRDAEARIEQSLREKEVMLKEIHHRVKNNMQIVSSLLNLQVEHVDDEETRALFLDSQSRIASMALVHEKLYQSADLGHIDFSDYVRDLTENLVGSQGSRARNVRFKLQTDDLYLSIDTAIPCGLPASHTASKIAAASFGWQKTSYPSSPV